VHKRRDVTKEDAVVGATRLYAVATVAILISAIPDAAIGQEKAHRSFASASTISSSRVWRSGLLFAPTDDLASEAVPGGIAFQPIQLSGQTEDHPTPPSTGFTAFVRTTAADFWSFPQRPSTWVILGIGAAAALLAHPADVEVNAHIAGSDTVKAVFAPGKWIGSAYAQVGAAVGLYVAGRYLVPHIEGEPRTNKVSHLGYDLLRAQILSQALIHGVKYSVRRDRPTGECCSFPSGHAASAFAAASVLERHLGYRAAWPTLLAASYVAVSRLHDNRHFVSDIFFGSAIGMATGWTIVGRHGRNEYAVVPLPVNRGMGIALMRVRHHSDS
jgi:membrane-associated phospholipid phosphatase